MGHKKHNRSTSAPGNVHIIAGKWRRRRLSVAEVPGLRPTGSRQREILFNWVQNFLPGARCLDCFSGSGALGFEAVSRGAAQCDLIELDPKACLNLVNNKSQLDADHQIHIHHTDVIKFLKTNSKTYDLIFIDPPFDDCLHEQTLSQLNNSKCLSSNALVYLEAPANAQPLLDTCWSIKKTKTAGKIWMALIQQSQSAL
ncbi:MAG: 16S rRNA (guanine(966)-N(2))-methyltransferase RsmD [bacterium]